MEVCYINLWVNEERFDRLSKVGLNSLAKDVLAGMKLLLLPCLTQQKDKLLELYAGAKYDSATTKSIELLPAEIKSRLFELVIQKSSLDVIEDFLKEAT
ncbi:DUF6955 family protein [Chloroflexota bacterium]